MEYYLDCDILVIGSFKQIFKINLENYLVWVFWVSFN